MERIQQIDMYKALRTKSGTWEAPPKKESHDDGHNDGGETCLKQPIYRQRQGADRLIMYFEVLFQCCILASVNGDPLGNNCFFFFLW